MHLLLLSLTTLALALAACTPIEPPQAGVPGASGPFVTPDLTGTRWNLVHFGDPSAPQTPVADSRPVLSFDEPGRLGQTTGCNILGGEYSLHGSSLTVENLWQTEMACADPLMAQESAIAQALQAATTLTKTADALVIAFPGGELSYTRFVEPEPASLIGTDWQLDSLITGDLAQSLVAGSTITLTLTETGLSGHGGCNMYQAGWSGDPTALTISPVGSTKLACAEPMVTDQELQYFALLQAATAYTIEGNRLTLTGPEGALVFTTSAP